MQSLYNEAVNMTIFSVFCEVTTWAILKSRDDGKGWGLALCNVLSMKQTFQISHFEKFIPKRDFRTISGKCGENFIFI